MSFLSSLGDALMEYIVACQRGGVSNKPLGQRQKRTAYLIRPFLLRQGEPGTATDPCPDCSAYANYLLT